MMMHDVAIAWLQQPQNGVLAALILALTVYLLTRKRYKLPPGPTGIPILGWIPFFTETEMHLEALHLGKKYNSDIVSFYIGMRLVVVMNSFDMIQDAFKKRGEILQDRAPNLNKDFFTRGEGVIHSDGKVWQDQRRHALKVLRDFGMGKGGAEKIILHEVTVMKDELEKINGEPIYPYHLLSCATANVICALIFGKTFDYNDRKFLSLLSEIEKLVLSENQWLSVFPRLRHIPGISRQFKDLISTKNAVDVTVREEIRQHKEEFEEHNINDYIMSFLAEMKKRKNDKNDSSIFTEGQLVRVISDMFAAGTETSATTLRWGFGFMACHPEIQRRVQEEIDSNLAQDTLPTSMDKLSLPYTEAVLLEIQRWASLTPLGLPHTNVLHDVKVGGYDIPKGSNVFANIYAVLRSDSIWPYPNEFNPANFIDERGKLKNQDKMVAFSIGKRSCLGESLAKMELFLMFTSLMQAFDIKQEKGKPLVMEPNSGINLRTPKKFHVCFVKRN